MLGKTEVRVSDVRSGRQIYIEMSVQLLVMDGMPESERGVLNEGRRLFGDDKCKNS